MTNSPTPVLPVLISDVASEEELQDKPTKQQIPEVGIPIKEDSITMQVDFRPQSQAQEHIYGLPRCFTMSFPRSLSVLELKQAIHRKTGVRPEVQFCVTPSRVPVTDTMRLFLIPMNQTITVFQHKGGVSADGGGSETWEVSPMNAVYLRGSSRTSIDSPASETHHTNECSYCCSVFCCSCWCCNQGQDTETHPDWAKVEASNAKDAALNPGDILDGIQVAHIIGVLAGGGG